MKKFHKKNSYSFGLLLLALFLISPLFLQAQVTRNKRVNKSFSAKKVVSMDHRYGPLIVRAATDGQVRIEAEITVKAQKEEDAQLVLDEFDIAANESGSTLNLVTDFDVSSWEQNNSRIKLKFKKGKKVTNLKEVKIDIVLYVPALEELRLKNKYDNIEVKDNLAGDLALELYSGRFEVGNVGGALEMKLKYSKGKMGNFVNANLDLYDSEVEFGNGSAVSLVSKYSELFLGNLSSIDMEVYDDKIITGHVTGNITLIDKYSDITFGHFESARMDLYDSEVNLGDGGNVQIKSKYSDIKGTVLGDLHFELSYDDDILVDQVEYLKADSKYSNFKIDVLKKGFQLTSYDDDLHIGRLAGPLGNISFNGKYTDILLDLGKESKYHMEANLTH